MGGRFSRTATSSMAPRRPLGGAASPTPELLDLGVGDGLSARPAAEQQTNSRRPPDHQRAPRLKPCQLLEGGPTLNLPLLLTLLSAPTSARPAPIQGRPGAGSQAAARSDGACSGCRARPRPPPASNDLVKQVPAMVETIPGVTQFSLETLCPPGSTTVGAASLLQGFPGKHLGNGAPMAYHQVE